MILRSSGNIHAQSTTTPSVPTPPTMAVRFSQQSERAYVTDPEAAIDFSRVVHGEQRFVHHRPITAGDELVGVTTVDAVRSAGGHSMVTTRTELATTAGDAVATSTSTIVVRGGEE